MSELSDRILVYLAEKDKPRTVFMLVRKLKAATWEMNIAVSKLRESGQIANSKIGRANAYRGLKWVKTEPVFVYCGMTPLHYGVTSNGSRDGCNDYKQWASKGGD